VSKAKLKVLSTSVWDQVDRLVADPVASVEKSRPLLGQSKRIRASPEAGTDTAGRASGGEELERDEEVYDDMHFYSMLLKVMGGTSFYLQNP
jgi:hypothetical protein